MSIYLVSDYFGTRQIVFDNNMNTIETHSKRGVGAVKFSYSIHVVVEYNLSGSKIICHQIYSMGHPSYVRGKLMDKAVKEMTKSHGMCLKPMYFHLVKILVLDMMI